MLTAHDSGGVDGTSLHPRHQRSRSCEHGCQGLSQSSTARGWFSGNQCSALNPPLPAPTADLPYKPLGGATERAPFPIPAFTSFARERNASPSSQTSYLLLWITGRLLACNSETKELINLAVIKMPSGSFHHGSVVTNMTSIHEDRGLIPSLTQWVKDPVLP